LQIKTDKKLTAGPGVQKCTSGLFAAQNLIEKPSEGDIRQNETNFLFKLGRMIKAPVHKPQGILKTSG